MSLTRRRITTATSLCCLLAATAAVAASARPTLQLDSLGEPGGASLELLWKRELGSGYSGIVVADDLAITMFSDGERDWVVALDTASGEETWRRDLGPTFRGSGGSENGPSSTPAADGDAVYALGPNGDLLALRLEDGRPLWSVEIDRVAKARAPTWGFATTPVVEGELVIVQTGGSEPFAVSAFERTSGALRWSTGGDPMAYQSPGALTLAGVRQIVSVSNENLAGLSPSSGEQLWSYRYGKPELAGASRVLQVSPDTFLLTASSDGSWWSHPASLYRARGEGDSGGIEKVWTSRYLQRSYAVPVVHKGHLYGFNGGFLSCVDLDDGELVWRSRPPGGRDLTAVEGTLLILAPAGDLVAVAATPDGYREMARVPALAEDGFAPPAVGAGRVFVRNHREIAALGTADGSVAATSASLSPARGSFQSFLERLETAADKKALVDVFLSRQERFPIVEEDGSVHFVYRGPAQDVAILGTMTDLYAPDQLQRVAGTDLFYRSYRFERGGRWQYFFELDFDTDEPVVDPLNPQRVRLSWGEMSELRMPGWSEPDHLAKLPAPRGRLESFTFASARLGNEREVRVYLPPGYSAGSRLYPLLVVNGLGPLERGLLDRSLDHLIGDIVPPIVAAFVAETPRPTWYDEYLGDRAEDLANALAEELVPALEARYRVLTEAGSHAILGVHETALTAMYAALMHPEVFGAVAAQAVRLLPPARDEVLRRIGEPGRVVQRYYVAWNRSDYRDRFYTIDYTAHSRELHSALERAGHEVAGGEAPGGGGWGSVAARNDAMLNALFPGSPSSMDGGPRAP